MKTGNYRVLVKNLGKKRRQPLPSSVMLEITQRCNLKCKFCYLGSCRESEPDMPLRKVFNILDQLQEAGCMEVILLGGEPVIRKDFVQIYRYIKVKGMMVAIWTNGTLINRKIADLFKEYPPHHLRISLYAASPKGYKEIADNASAFKRIKEGAKLLKKRRVYFTFRSVLTRINVIEFEKMKKFAESIKVNFHGRTCITSTTSRDFNPKKFKITPEQRDILERYAEDYVPLKWEDKTQKKLDKKGCRGCLYISNNGNLLACLLYRRRYRYNLEKTDLRQAWENRLQRKIIFKCPSA